MLFLVYVKTATTRPRRQQQNNSNINNINSNNNNNNNNNKRPHFVCSAKQVAPSTRRTNGPSSRPLSTSTTTESPAFGIANWNLAEGIKMQRSGQRVVRILNVCPIFILVEHNCWQYSHYTLITSSSASYV